MELHDYYKGELSMWDIALRFFRGICPMVFFDEEIDFYIGLESAANRYSTLPYQGGYMDQPNTIIEAFDIIRGTRSLYEHKRSQEINKEAKKHKDK